MSLWDSAQLFLSIGVLRIFCIMPCRRRCLDSFHLDKLFVSSSICYTNCKRSLYCLEACINLFCICCAVLSKVGRAFLKSAHQNLEIWIMIQSLQEKGIFPLHFWVEWKSLRLKLSCVWAPRLNTNKEWIIFGLLCMLCPTLNYAAKSFPSLLPPCPISKPLFSFVA